MEVGAALDGVRGFLRSCFGGESAFLQTLECRGSSGDALLCAQEIGDIALVELTGNDVLLQKGAFLASHMSIDVSSTAQLSASKALFSGAGVFILRACGHGTLAINAHGGLVQYSLRSGETRAVDNGHLVAWDAQMPYELRMASRRSGFLGSIFNSAASGEGMMCFFHGPGRLWLQTHKNPEPACGDGNRSRSRSHGSNGAVTCIFVLICLLIVAGILLAIAAQSVTFGGLVPPSSSSKSRSGSSSSTWGASRAARGGGREGGRDRIHGGSDHKGPRNRDDFEL